jgi:hypothetical protein
MAGEGRVTEDVDQFVAFCDGVEEAGLVEYARRGRSIAHDLERALRELADERSARRALHEARDTLLDLLVARGVDRHEAEILADEPGPAGRRQRPDCEVEL